jgi:hypothetical protein
MAQITKRRKTMIEKNIYRVTCDCKGCKNIAQHVFPAKGRLGKFYICDACLSKLSMDYEAAKGTKCPKSPKNAIKRIMDDKSDSIKLVAEN